MGASTAISQPSPTCDHFLRRWFHVLSNRVTLSDRHALDLHSVRVESSKASDWWVQVQPPKRCPCSGRYPNQEASSTTTQDMYFRELREALVLVTAYARLDYDVWLQEMTNTCGLRFPHDGRLDSRFSFVVGDDRTDYGIHSCELLANTLGAANHPYSDEFKASYKELLVRADKRQVPCGSLQAPIPVRFEFSQLSTSHQRNVETLARLGNSIARMLWSNCKASTIPFFELDCVELRLRGHELNGRTLATVGRILSTGVRIRHLELPGRLRETIDQGERHLWVRSLARRLFDPSNRGSSPSVPQIARLELPPAYFSTDLAVSWLPFLTMATNVRSLTIYGDVAIIGPARPSTSTLAWVYLAYAMVSVDSNNSIESLHLSGLSNITTEIIQSVGAVMASQMPLAELEQALQNHPRGLDQQFTINNAIRRPQATNLSGNKLQKLVLSVSKKITVGSDPAKVASLMTQVLRGTGTKLIDLAIDGAPIHDEDLRDWLEFCPSLVNLRLNGATLQSFDPLLACQNLSSLDLRSIRTSQEASRTFFESLKTGDSANMKTLDRLRIGNGWSGHISALTPKILDEILIANQSLAYLHVYRPNDPFSRTPTATWNRLKSYDGKLISSRDRPLALDCKIAFLATTEKLAEKTLMMPLNYDVLAQIFEFAARPRRRTVVIDSNMASCT